LWKAGKRRKELMCGCASWCVDKEVEVLGMQVYMPTDLSLGYY
jgi:hypothetical protein